PEARAELLSAVVQTATSVMGTPYRWGGEGANGFDCSGLIQYAYRQHGVMLPRRGVDQAREGRGIDRSLDALIPGDILTFSQDNDRVTHVGLYLGDGKFIHSATGGVQLSVLSPDDTYGRWWWNRWVGARRIIE
ncbi:MAG: C40 family peptidase, partial [Gemmatimonadales bacterium]